MSDSEPHTDPAGELRDAIVSELLEVEVWPLDWSYERCRTIATQFAARLLASEQFTIGLRAQRDDYERVGTWLLPESYGPTYGHFTETHAETDPRHRIALYAKRSDVAARTEMR